MDTASDHAPPTPAKDLGEDAGKCKRWAATKAETAEEAQNPGAQSG